MERGTHVSLLLCRVLDRTPTHLVAQSEGERRIERRSIPHPHHGRGCLDDDCVSQSLASFSCRLQSSFSCRLQFTHAAG